MLEKPNYLTLLGHAVGGYAGRLRIYNSRMNEKEGKKKNSCNNTPSKVTYTGTEEVLYYLQ